MTPIVVSPLATWFADDGALRRFRQTTLGRRPVVLPPRDRDWRAIAPGFETAVTMAGSGLPFQIAAERRYDRDADRRRLRPALAAGKTVFMPQVHQVLPRLARLMVALRAALLGPFREECSFLFVVQGRGRQGMGLHHDGDVDSFWLQLEGRRTVTLGRSLPAGTPEDLDDELVGTRRDGWRTLDLQPGTLFHMPPRTPHRVVCFGRSLAVSLTWSRARARARGGSAWDVVSGRVDAMPPASRRWLWTQVPVTAPARRDGRVTLRMADGATVSLPAGARALAERLAQMPHVSRSAPRARQALALLGEHGILGERDLPLRIVPDDLEALDGWRFA